MSPRRFYLLVLSTALVIGIGVVAFAPPPSDPLTDRESVGVGTEGLKVAFDPETGDLVPVKSEAPEKGIASLSRSDLGLVKEYHSNGSVSIDLQGRFQCQATATVDANGNPQIQYAHGQGNIASAVPGKREE